MNILNELKTDHDAAKSLLKRILTARDASKRGTLFKEFKAAITAHSRSEEKVFYRRLEQTKEGKDDALEGFVEHEVADRLIEDLDRSDSKESDQWTARCTVLQELLKHHIEEEQSEFFTIARKMFNTATLKEMGQEFVAEKRKYDVSPSVEMTAAE